MRPVLLATCAALPEGDEDAAVLNAALADLGIDSRCAVWTDEDTDWDDALVVVRSTWDYSDRRGDFLAWAAALPRVANPAPVLAWNSDKLYLRDLAAAGVPIVATRFFADAEPIDLDADYEIVVKPSVGAGSRGAGRFTPARRAAALAHAADLRRAGRVVLVQPYLEAVDTAGETSLVYFGGEFSHAIRKGPMLPDGVAHPVDGWELFVEEIISPRSPSAAELDLGSAALAAVADRFGGEQLYARVDLLPGPDGPLLTELELTEPSLFLGRAPAAATSPAQRFAAAIAAMA